MKGAIDSGKEGAEAEQSNDKRRQSEIDFQLARAIDLIHGVSIFNNVSAEKFQ